MLAAEQFAFTDTDAKSEVSFVQWSNFAGGSKSKWLLTTAISVIGLQ